MSSDNPFERKEGGRNASAAGRDPTIMKPKPGGRLDEDETKMPEDTPRPPTPKPLPTSASPQQFAGSGVNPLVAAAGPLFSLVGQLSETRSHSDVASLYRHVVEEIDAFEATAMRRGVAADTVLRARYGICVLLDEVVLNTPWGARSSWMNETLLIRFHRTGYGGEEFFRYLSEAMQSPNSNIDLLEFFYICLGLGLNGMYFSMNDGRRRLEQIREEAYAVIRNCRGGYETELSPAWKGVTDDRPKLVRYVPLWAVGAVAGLLVALVYAAFLYAVSDMSDPVVASIAGLAADVEMPSAGARISRIQTERLTLAQMLARQRETGNVDVVDQPGRSVIAIRRLFPPGQAQIDSAFLPLVREVAEVLDSVPGDIQVIGHTDNIPIRSLRFPSNWELSKLRAESVTRALARIVDERRLLDPKGLADSRPIVDNLTPQNRETNRRVEIVVVPPAGEM